MNTKILEGQGCISFQVKKDKEVTFYIIYSKKFLKTLDKQK
jgi:hypothetical protein